MKKTNLLNLIITLTIGIVLTGSLLVPVVNDAEDGQRITYNNVGLNARLVEDETITYTWAAGTGITIGGETIAHNAAANGPTTLFMTDTGYFKTNFAGTIALFYEFDGSPGAGNNITAATITVNPTAKTVTISNITASTSLANVTINYNEWAIVPAKVGDLVFWAPYSASKVMHQNTDATIYSVFNPNANLAMSFKGDELTHSLNLSTYSKNFEGTAIAGYDGIEDYTVGTNASDGYTVTVNGTAYHAGAMAFERTAVGVSSNGGGELISLLSILPVMVIIGLVTIAARAISGRND